MPNFMMTTMRHFWEKVFNLCLQGMELTQKYFCDDFFTPNHTSFPTMKISTHRRLDDMQTWEVLVDHIVRWSNIFNHFKHDFKQISIAYPS